MNNSLFVEIRFWLLVLCSLVAPLVIYTSLLVKRAISRKTVLLLGVVLVWIAGLDVYLLQILSLKAKLTPSLADDYLFSSELSMALYLLPLLFGGVGVNLVSHVLTQHLREAEARYDAENPER
jgi:hypothetical protein